MGLAELSGLVTGLSGRIDLVELRMLNVEKNVLRLPSKADYNTLSQSNTARFNTLQAASDANAATLNTLIEYISNLKLSHTALESSFSGHTGQFVYGLSGSSSSGVHR